jgi:hypothetical protein
MLKLRHCSIPYWQTARLADGIRRRLHGSDSFIEIVGDIPERIGAENIATPSAPCLTTANPFRSVATQQAQIAVPNFVPFVPEIVPYPDVSSSYSIVLSRILM